VTGTLTGSDESAEGFVPEAVTVPVTVTAPADGGGPGPPGRSHAHSIFHSDSVLYGAFAWARKAEGA
jgi:hypothetical protein